MNRTLRDRRRLGSLIRSLMLLVALICAALALDGWLRPVISTMSAYQARAYATDAINNAVSDLLWEWEQKGGRIVTVTYGSSGEVTAIQTDMVALNLLKTQITRAASEEIALLEEQNLKIPIGTLFGGPVFSGRGPRVTIKILPVGYVETDIVNQFDSAGINQTRHQIYVTVTASVAAILPGYTSSANLSAGVCVAETIIIGAVPETFAELYMGEEGKSPWVTQLRP